MKIHQKAVKTRRQYNQWVTNQTLEDYALRFTPHRSRRWSIRQVVLTAISAITFLALEALGGTLTLTWGFDVVFYAVLIVCPLMFLLSLPISICAARYGLDIDLLTRGAGFGYLGSTVTSLIYASFTFIFFAIEAVIMTSALNLLFDLPMHYGYLLSTLVVLPIVIWGFTFISHLQRWTQAIWIVLQLLPFVMILLSGNSSLGSWTGFKGLEADNEQSKILAIGAAATVMLSLVAQVGEQVDQIRFLPAKDPRRPLRWWISVVLAGPGWVLIGGAKIMLGSFLAVLAFNLGLDRHLASEPTHMYLVGFSYVTDSKPILLALTGIFVVLSQIKINVTNAYAGSIAWSNFFLRLTHRHPGRVVWLFFNVGIALLLMELGVYQAFESILSFYAIIAIAWLGSVVADLVINKSLGWSPPGIEFRRAYLYDINPVGVGSMMLSMLLGFGACFAWFGPQLQAFSALFTLGMTFVLTPLLAWLTQGKFYLARPPEAVTETCCVICGNHFEPAEMSHCPLYRGAICSLCCSLDVQCQGRCIPDAHYRRQIYILFSQLLPGKVLQRISPSFWSFISILLLFNALIGFLLMLIYLQMRNLYGGAPDLLAATLWKVFFILFIVTGVTVWLFILTNKSREVAQAELQLQTELLMEEITAHEATDEALQRAKKSADKANQAKSRYLTSITHELRTPLNAMLGYAQLLEDADDIPRTRREGVGVIRRSGEHLANLIEGLLDISKIEAGRMELQRHPLRIGEFMQQLVELFRHQARDKGIQFIYQLQHPLPDWVIADENRLRQILINLLSNAIKFTDSGSVTLEADYRGEVAFFRVMDTGIGIPPEHLEKIFLPFERLQQQGVRAGTGLGLTITRLLTYVMGGELLVRSQPGEGTEFRLRLMLPSYAGSAEKVGQAQQIIGYEGEKRTIMVVDDDTAHHDLMCDILNPIGFRVLLAEDANGCLSQDLSHVHLLILDIGMAGMSGWQLVSALRARGDTHPVLMLSAELSSHEKNHNGDTGLLRCQAKPVRLPLMLENIRVLLGLNWHYRQPSPGCPADRLSQQSDHLSIHEKTQLLNLVQRGNQKGFLSCVRQRHQEGKLCLSTTRMLTQLAQHFRFAQLITSITEMEISDDKSGESHGTCR